MSLSLIALRCCWFRFRSSLFRSYIYLMLDTLRIRHLFTLFRSDTQLYSTSLLMLIMVLATQPMCFVLHAKQLLKPKASKDDGWKRLWRNYTM